jgi:transposase
MFSLGIDVSKSKLDCVLLDGSTGKQRDKSVLNTAAGVAALLTWLEQRHAVPGELAVVMEPTGVYHETALYALHQARLKVYLVNPARARHFAQATGQRGKSDAADSQSLAKMGQHPHDLPPLWSPPPQNARFLKALLARRAALAEDLQRERNRLEKAQATLVPEAVHASIGQAIVFIERQLQALQREIDDLIDGDDDLTRRHALLKTIDGVGERVADEMTAILGCSQFDSAEQVACYLGLTPEKWESGTSVRGRSRISKAGPARLRQLLYMPAIVAARCNRHVRELFNRLVASGKPKKVALVAAMRKLVHLCFGVVRSNTPYQREKGAAMG